MNISKCVMTCRVFPFKNICYPREAIFTTVIPLVFCNKLSRLDFHKTGFTKCSDNGDSIKKRSRLRKYVEGSSLNKPRHWNVVAYATAEGYDLHKLRKALAEQALYIPSELTSNEPLQSGVGCALHAVAKYQVTPENRHIYCFEEGSVVMWNVSTVEQNSIIQFLKPFEVKSYSSAIVQEEMELMFYTYNQSKKTYIHDGVMYIGIIDKDLESIASDRYTLSNAMSLSVKLGVLEVLLDMYICDTECLSEDLKIGNPVRLGQRGILRKSGELFALRHSINLSTDLLDTPDFYWDRENLESLYQRSCYYFSIPRRTKVMNEKLNHCVELIQLVSSHLSDRHHVRLEWMIIVLILVEVMFEILHFFGN
ncbi:unnamed protein product [Nezara viridula]|uniref:DUF155 domain-containing protein n=1 Tax=Nezara viridula TaxID=85310 RepID=A0A9P0H3I0_NEZVI|nr:unnamed protein product [Nezara viridula]